MVGSFNMCPFRRGIAYYVNACDISSAGLVYCFSI